MFEIVQSRVQGALQLPRIFTCEMRQDDPAKCTSAKLRKMGYARNIARNQIPKEAIVLNPSSKARVLTTDRTRGVRYGLVVIDCSWNLVESTFNRHFSGAQRRLPLLLAGNPTNYSAAGKLSSVEAIAATLYIMGFKEFATRLLSIYKWGGTFLTLNHDPLEEYSRAATREEMLKVETSFFPHIAL